ncbi:putative protein phosphatase 2C 37 [Panicum miliaceum]|uniref:protein-serine/threonine phosphatase n=1 Tax=Panicum miliaceum TaxID=4540 RepID=A0A3L6PSR9_PANMI|nr:putative protein phosphatase 2C 37 [Panicum miliaceum]
MQVSELCRDRMHVFLAKELAAEEADLAQRLRRRQQQEAASGEGTGAAGAGAWTVKQQQQQEEERAWRAALHRTFRRVDAMASLACACGRIAVSPPCRCPLAGNSGIVGSTAVVAVLVRGRLIVANCGDSRAVLCRGPDGAPPVQLSDDHKIFGEEKNGWLSNIRGENRVRSMDHRWISTGREAARTSKRGHAVAVPWISRNLWGGRGSPSLSPGGHVAAATGDSVRGVMAVGGYVSVAVEARGATEWPPGGGPGSSEPRGARLRSLPPGRWALDLQGDGSPNRPDELARIQAAGGRVVFNNGHRVRGILAMSRALGDRMLRPEVIAEPEITVTDRTPEDQCLILASDGMWDAVPNEIACSVARQCLQDGNPGAPVGDAAAAAGPEPEARCSNAASLLVRLAFGRDSWDNISVIVIDLQQRE